MVWVMNITIAIVRLVISLFAINLKEISIQKGWYIVLLVVKNLIGEVDIERKENILGGKEILLSVQCRHGRR